MRERFQKQTEREYSPGKRFIALLIEAIFFLGVLPATLIFLSSFLDYRFDLPPLFFGAINALVGWLLVVAGFLFAIWAIYIQFTLGRGTPVPVMATQELIILRPYNYCRNPMALGTIVLYLGVAVLLGSISAVVLVLTGAILLLLYIRFLEEREMEMRFGEAYQVYRKQTPFILPRLWQRK